MDPDSESRQQPRAALETPVHIRHSDLGEFLEEHSSNISTSGMFITTSRPLPPGTSFEFRFSIDQDVTVISGTAEVVWVREQPSGPEQPAGMGVRFVKMDDLSRTIIFRIVDLFITRTGGEPFQLE